MAMMNAFLFATRASISVIHSYLYPPRQLKDPHGHRPSFRVHFVRDDIGGVVDRLGVHGGEQVERRD